MRTTEKMYNSLEKQLGFSCTVEDSVLILQTPGAMICEKVDPLLHPDGVYVLMMEELYRVGDLGQDRLSLDPGEMLASIRLNAEDMKVVLKGLPTYIDKKHPNEVLTCVNYRNGVLCATDAHTLRTYRSSCSEEAEINLPILSAVGLLEKDVTVRKYSNWVEFDFDGQDYYQVWVRAVDGRYPLYENVIPKMDLPAILSVDTKVLKNNILPYAKKDPSGAAMLIVTFDKMIVDYEYGVAQWQWPLTRPDDVPAREADGVLMPMVVQTDGADQELPRVKRLKGYGIEVAVNGKLLERIATGYKGVILAYESPDRPLLFWLC